jgi:hypothetical protein
MSTALNTILLLVDLLRTFSNTTAKGTVKHRLEITGYIYRSRSNYENVSGYLLEIT